MLTVVLRFLSNVSYVCQLDCVDVVKGSNFNIFNYVVCFCLCILFVRNRLIYTTYNRICLKR